MKINSPWLPVPPWRERNLTRLLNSKHTSLILSIFSVATVTILLYWRRPDAFTNPQLWAEDASRLVTNAHLSGFASLFMPFGGYYHTLARLIALVGALIPLQFVPHLYHLAFWLVLVFTIGYIFSDRFDFNPGVKSLLAIMIVANPVGNEVFWNLANFPFFTSLLLLLLVLSRRPCSRRQIAFDYLLLIFVGLSTPYAICLWPLFILRWLADRTRHNQTLALLALLVALIQVSNMAYRINDGGALPPLDPRLFDAVIYRAGFLLLGEHVYQITFTTVLRVYGLIIVLSVFGYLTWRAIQSRNHHKLMLLLGTLAASTLSLYVLRHNFDYAIHTQRHAFLPVVALMWALSLTQVPSPRLERTLLAATLVTFFFLTPHSKGEVRPDLQWAEHVAQCLGKQPLCRIPVNPVIEPPVWFAHVDPYRLPPPTVQHEYSASFADKISLLGYNLEQKESSLDLTLLWQAQEKMVQDYKFFIHLSAIDNPEEILAQHDAMPLNWNYPTSSWREHEVIAEDITLSLASLAPGNYQVSVGWYLFDFDHIQRLPARDSQGTIQKNHEIILPTLLSVP